MERIGIIAASLSARNDGHTCHPYSYATKPLALRNCPPEFLGTRSLSDIDRSTAANDPRPSTSFSARKNPQRISANTLPVFPGLWPRIWPRLIRLVTKAMSDRLLVDYLSGTREFPSSVNEWD